MDNRSNEGPLRRRQQRCLIDTPIDELAGPTLAGRTMSAAYATLGSGTVSRATSELQIVQRVGSTFGSALFAVVLAQRIAASGAGADANAGAAQGLPKPTPGRSGGRWL